MRTSRVGAEGISTVTETHNSEPQALHLPKVTKEASKQQQQKGVAVLAIIPVGAINQRLQNSTATLAARPIVHVPSVRGVVLLLEGHNPYLTAEDARKRKNACLK